MPHEHILDGVAAAVGLPLVMHVGDIADCFGVPRQTVTKWTKLDGWPTDTQTLKAGIAWWTEHILAWTARRGLFPIALGAQLVEPLTFAEPLAAREMLIFDDTEHLSLVAPGDIVQILPIDTNELANLVLPGTMAVWCEVHPDDCHAPPHVLRTHGDTLFVARSARQLTALDAMASSSRRPRVIDLERSDDEIAEGAAVTGLAPARTRITIAVPNGTAVSVDDRNANYLIGDTLALDLHATDTTLRAGRLDTTRLDLAGESSAQVQRVIGDTLDVTHRGSGSTTVVGGDVDTLALTTSGTTTIEYGGCAKVATRLFAGPMTRIAANVVEQAIRESVGNVDVHCPPRNQPHTFWLTLRSPTTDDS